MGFTDCAGAWGSVSHVRVLSVLVPLSRPKPASVPTETLLSAKSAIGAASQGIASLLGGASTGLADSIAKVLFSNFFRSLSAWVANGAASLVGVLGKALSASTEPMLSASAFRHEFDVMALLSAAVALPLVAIGAIQAIIRQEPGGLLRSVLVRLPLALLFTGVSVQLVALGLSATDQASAMVLDAAGDPTHRLLGGLVNGLNQTGGFGMAAFAVFLVVLGAAVVAFLLWAELAVRSAAIAAAALFLPLAMVGLAWPATAHWARRLGETLTALVLSKLVIAAVLALAAGLLGSSSGVSGVVEGVALLAVAALAPFALLKLVPAVESGAVAHFEGLSRRSMHSVEHLGQQAAGLVAGGEGDMAVLAGQSVGSRMSGQGGTGSSGESGSGTRVVDRLGAGPWTADRDGNGEPASPGATSQGQAGPVCSVVPADWRGSPGGESTPGQGQYSQGGAAPESGVRATTTDVDHLGAKVRWELSLDQGELDNG